MVSLRPDPDDAPHLYHPDLLRAHRIAAYLHVLNEHSPLLAELRDLARRHLQPHLEAELRAILDADAERIAAGQLGHLMRACPTFDELTDDVGAELSAFAEHWRLPTTVGIPPAGPRLVWESIEHLAWGIPLERIRLTGPSSFAVWPPEVSVTIEAPGLEPFRYDPTEHAPAWLRAVAKQTPPQYRAGILHFGKQAEARARAAGWRPLSSRYCRAGELIHQARRVFRYRRARGPIK